MLDVVLRVRKPTVGVRREVRIVGAKDDIRRDVLFELDEKTFFAHVYEQGIKRLHPIQLLRRDLRLAQG